MIDLSFLQLSIRSLRLSTVVGFGGKHSILVKQQWIFHSDASGIQLVNEPYVVVHSVFVSHKQAHCYSFPFSTGIEWMNGIYCNYFAHIVEQIHWRFASLEYNGLISVINPETKQPLVLSTISIHQQHRLSL